MKHLGLSTLAMTPALQPVKDRLRAKLGDIELYGHPEVTDAFWHSCGWFGKVYERGFKLELDALGVSALQPSSPQGSYTEFPLPLVGDPRKADVTCTPLPFTHADAVSEDVTALVAAAHSVGHCVHNHAIIAVSKAAGPLTMKGGTVHAWQELERRGYPPEDLDTGYLVLPPYLIHAQPSTIRAIVGLKPCVVVHAKGIKVVTCAVLQVRHSIGQEPGVIRYGL